MCLEPFLHPSKKSLNVVKAIRHLLELRFGTSHRFRKILSARFLSAFRSAIDKFSFSFFGKTVIRKTGKSLVAPRYTQPERRRFPPFRDADFSKSTSSTDHVSTFRVSRSECHDIRTLLLAKKPASFLQ